MILLLVLFGFVAGTAAALLAFVGGSGVLGALVAYSLFGVLAVLLTALLVSVAPVWRSEPMPAPDRLAGSPFNRGERG